MKKRLNENSRNMSKNINAEQFDFEAFKKIPVQQRGRGNPGTKSKFRYKDIVTAFDIETTRIEEIEQSVMYVWQWAFDDVCVIGRTWDEFLSFCEKLTEALGENERLCVFIHNASYEFQFLKGIYDFKTSDIFAMTNRKVLRFFMFGNKLEFRCSYLHSNMNLKEYLDKMGVPDQKLTMDYDKKRYPWTELTDEELAYCTHDVTGLVQAIKVEMQHDGDNLYTFPLTSTGYVRRDAKRVMHSLAPYYVKKQLPNLHIYTMLREAFRGGNTHANRFYAKQIVTDVHSCDRSSSYPDVLVNQRYPCGKFIEIGEISEDYFRELYETHKAILMRVSFVNIRLREYKWGCPYLSRDKCRDIYNGVFDNGRILAAEYLQTTITDIDFCILEEEYEWDDVYFLDVAYTRYGELPKRYKELINEYYRRKTDLKGIPSEELNYFRAKQKLNSLYGLSAMMPVRTPIKFENNMLVEAEEVDVAAELEKDNKRRVLLPYQVGVWCTAWARLELERGIRLVHKTKGAAFIYTDTDSIKYTGNVSFKGYNRHRISASKRNGAFATDPNGKTHYMGVFEDEGIAKEFVTLGAKKYAYTDEKGKLHITVAGVIKNAGARELEAHGGIREFKPDFIFVESGGLEAVYNDFPEITDYEVDGHKLHITSNVVLRPSTYTLGITNEYEYLLKISGLENYVDIF